MSKALSGLLEPESAEVIGHAEVRACSRFEPDCCGMLCHGRQHPRNALTRVLRDGVVVHEGSIESLKVQDDVREVAGFECGIGLGAFQRYPRAMSKA